MTEDESLLREMWSAYTLHATPMPFSVREAMAAVLAVVRAHDRDGERQESALHLAVMSAVGQLNLSTTAATCALARGARDTLRQALVDYADAAMRAEG